LRQYIELKDSGVSHVVVHLHPVPNGYVWRSWGFRHASSMLPESPAGGEYTDLAVFAEIVHVSSIFKSIVS